MSRDPQKGPFPASWWSEEDGDVLWWHLKDGRWSGEAPYVGSPLDLGHTVEIRNSFKPSAEPVRMLVGGWPAYHTHWTRIEVPPVPE